MIPRINSEILYVLQIFNSVLIQDYLDDSTPTNDVNNSLENVENILMTAAKRSLKTKITKKRRRTRSFPNKKMVWQGVPF